MQFGVKHSPPRSNKHMQMITLVHSIKHKSYKFQNNNKNKEEN